MKTYRLYPKPKSLDRELLFWIIIAAIGIALVSWALTHPETLMEIVGA